MIQIEITTRCNARCIYCFREGIKEKNFKSMDMQTFKKAVDIVPWSNNRWLLQGAGEPLLSQYIYEMCDYIYQKDPDSIIETITNGSLLTESVFYELIKHHLTRLSISVDAMGDQYEEIRKGMKWGKIEEILRFVKKYKESNENPIQIGIDTVVMKSNLFLLNDFLDYISKFSVDFLSMNTLIDIYGNLQHEVLDCVESEDVTRVMTKLKKQGEELGIRVITPILGDDKKLETRSNHMCTFSEKGMYIDVDGRIDPCCMLSSEGRWGDLNNPKVDEINSFAKLWRESKYPFYCVNCIENGIAFLGK